MLKGAARTLRPTALDRQQPTDKQNIFSDTKRQKTLKKKTTEHHTHTHTHTQHGERPPRRSRSTKTPPASISTLFDAQFDLIYVCVLVHSILISLSLSRAVHSKLEVPGTNHIYLLFMFAPDPPQDRPTTPCALLCALLCAARSNSF